MLITLIILAATVVMLAMERFRNDLVAFGSLLSLMLLGILSPREALSGFANPVVFVMAGMFIVGGAIVRTGLAAILSDRILRAAGRNTDFLFMLIMILTALIGSVVSNTGTVAIMMPIVVGMAPGLNESPGRFLMPLAFMSSIGGMFTILGNSSNMVVNDVYVNAGYPSLTLLSFLPVGTACFLFGVLVVAPVTSRYLSRRKHPRSETKARCLSVRGLADKYRLADKMYRLEVLPGSAVAGRRLDDLNLPERYGVMVAEMTRGGDGSGYFGLHHREWFFPEPDTEARTGDHMRVMGSVTGVTMLAEETGLRLSPDVPSAQHHFSSAGICELVVTSSSKLTQRTVADSDLRRQFGVMVLGVQRGNHYLLDNLKDEVIQPGDSLLVHGSWENLARLEEHFMDWVVVGRPKEEVGKDKLREKIPVVAVVVAAMLGVMAFNLVPTVVAVLLAALALVVGGCFKNMDDVYAAMNWEPLVMLACLLPVALVMEKAGVVDMVSGRMVSLCTRHGPHVALAVIYGATSLLNIVISTTPISLLIAPVAMQVAQSLGYNPLPFLFAVATGTSMCFASPFSSPSNALVMSAGRYTFADYFKIGLPLQLLMGAFMVAALPVLYPFAADV